jgi:hypothetical protein
MFEPELWNYRIDEWHFPAGFIKKGKTVTKVSKNA